MSLPGRTISFQFDKCRPSDMHLILATASLSEAAEERLLNGAQAVTAAGFMSADSVAQMDVDNGIVNTMFNISRSPSEKSSSGDCDAPAFRNPLYSNRGSPSS